MPCCSEVGEVVHSLTLIEVVVVVIKSGLSKLVVGLVMTRWCGCRNTTTLVV